MYGQFLHTCLISQDTSLGTLTAGVDSQYRQASAFLFQQMNAKLINRGRLTSSRHATDTDTHTLSAIGQTLIDYLLRLSLMVGIHTLYQRHRLRENRHVTLYDTLNHFADTQLTPAETVTLQVRIDDRGLLHPTIHLQASIFSTILGMLHFFVVSLFRCSVISLSRCHDITSLHINFDNHLRVVGVVGNHQHTRTLTSLQHLFPIDSHFQLRGLTRLQFTPVERHLHALCKHL